MLLAEDLLLLLTDDETGRGLVDRQKTGLALAGAVLVELVQRERLGMSGPGEPVPAGRVVVRDATATGDPVLDAALRRAAAKAPAKPKSLLGPLGKGLRDDLLARLVERGVLSREHRRVLWVFPVTRHPERDPSPEAALRRGLHDVLVTGRSPQPREAVLVSLLSSLDAVPAVLGLSGAEAKAVKRRAKAVAESDAASAVGSEAVRRALRELDAALLAAVSAAAAGAAATSGS